jgi:hypothetical protein
MGVRAWVLPAAITALALLAGCGDDETAGDEQTLTYTEGRGGDFTPIGGATERRAPPGSGFVLSAPMEDESGSTVGELNAVCIASRESSGRALTGFAPARPTCRMGSSRSASAARSART